MVEEKNTEPVKSRETQSEKKDAAEQIVREENEAGKSSKGLFTFRFWNLTLSLNDSLFFLGSLRLGFRWQVVREHYLRDDIYCGASICKVCDSSTARLSPSASTILILDTNVVLNQVKLFSLFLFFSIFFWFFDFIFGIEFIEFRCGGFRLICWRIRRLMTSWCCLWCWKKLRTRIFLFTTDLEPFAATLWGNSLFSQTNITSRVFLILQNSYANWLFFLSSG